MGTGNGSPSPVPCFQLQLLCVVFFLVECLAAGFLAGAFFALAFDDFALDDLDFALLDFGPMRPALTDV